MKEQIERDRSCFVLRVVKSCVVVRLGTSEIVVNRNIFVAGWIILVWIILVWIILVWIITFNLVM
jgi:hypothetical protein